MRPYSRTRRELKNCLFCSQTVHAHPRDLGCEVLGSKKGVLKIIVIDLSLTGNALKTLSARVSDDFQVAVCSLSPLRIVDSETREFGNSLRMGCRNEAKDFSSFSEIRWAPFPSANHGVLQYRHGHAIVDPRRRTLDVSVLSHTEKFTAI
ncbi:hypothetical protein A7U60_g1169 [Sanghuangporus baumii]|uniref:Uncharacterized protein n=1 Tax=Sanghuangporus baumii TaxID=108892 RepID=A0A9Q5I4J5_SANBA|nr:hypothetical protein A7U60_g1169 [Sanghuangporus baumii]